tara:strand:- start:125 stop:427 length:303 start_codon:yes stop_codon:yes gene_type:complete
MTDLLEVDGLTAVLFFLLTLTVAAGGTTPLRFGRRFDSKLFFPMELIALDGSEPPVKVLFAERYGVMPMPYTRLVAFKFAHPARIARLSAFFGHLVSSSN